VDKIRILLVDNDWNIGPVIKNYLEKDNFDVQLATDGKTALELFEKGKFNFCILEVVIPNIDGFEVIKKMRNINGKIPIMVLSNKSEEIDKIRAFECGVDDYMTKPFSMAELILRIKAIAKRCQGEVTEEKVLTIGDFMYNNHSKHIVYTNPQTNEKEISHLTVKEGALLFLLAQNTNNVVTRQEILSKVWSNETYMHARSIDVYITRLRRILSKDPNIRIVNQHGLGFKLVIENQQTTK
jgi:DNA-binding response OmpR family regulator